MKVTLKKNGIIEVKRGAFIARAIGTWHHTDVWKENGGSRDKSGNKLVKSIWSATLRHGRQIEAYSREDLIKIIIDKVTI